MKPVLKIIRLESRHHWGMFGVLLVQDEVFCVTLEPPYTENLRDISCIPSGQYIIRKHRSPRFGNTYIVCHVPNRTNILFHAGNVDRDTEGCILLGSSWGKLSGRRAVLNSGTTFRAFMDAMQGHDELHLTIKEEY